MHIDETRSRHGGYWRYSHIDFHYLVNQYFPPPELYAELREAVLKLANSYPSAQAVLAELQACWKEDHYFTAENLVVGNGSSELIKLLNDRVMTTTTVPLPTFNEFTIRPAGRMHCYALSEEEDFRLDVDRLLQEIRGSASQYAVIVNPNNPVGNLVELDDIRRVLESGVRLVVDEAFVDFAPGHSAEPLVPHYKNLIVVKSATKSMGIAGLRLGYVLTANEEVKRLLRESLPIWNVNSLAEYFLEAFPRYHAEYRESLDRIANDTNWFYDALQKVPFLDPFPAHANAVFCRVRGSARRLVELLFERHGLLVKDGIRQGGLETTASYVRMGVRNRQDNGKLLAALHTIRPEEIHGHVPS